jgi:phytoene synthase
MKTLFDTVSSQCSKIITKKYSTSFSLGIYFLGKEIRNPIYAIYGFVRLADEIVDSFHDYDKKYLLEKFIQDKISLNPVLNNFQHAVIKYNIEWDLIDTFLKSMEMDLNATNFDRKGYDQYIVGSAEVVGLMCLRVFTEGNDTEYNNLKYAASKLGSAFQKVNFLRDLNADYKLLGRTYFPNVDFEKFEASDKEQIQQEIDKDFNESLEGIKQLPSSSRMGVYLAYIYYRKLFNKIKETPAEEVLQARIRIPDINKVALLFQSMIRLKLNQF